ALSLTVGTFTDPGFTFAPAGTAETFTASVNWGDGSAAQAVTPSVTQGSAGVLTAGSVAGSHTYAAPGAYTVSVAVADDDGGTAPRPFPVTVSAHPAVIPSARNLSGTEGQSLAYTATFTDVAPGDTHTAVIAWGDGTTSAGVVTESGGSGTVTASHTYA